MSETLTTVQNTESKARLLRHALWNYANRKDTDADLDRLETAWTDVDTFPVRFRDQDYHLNRGAVRLALTSCGGPAIIGVELSNDADTLVLSPQTLFRRENRIQFLPPTLLPAGVQ